MSGRVAWPLFALSLVAYAYFYQGGGWNQNSRFDLTRALVEQGSFRIDAYHGNTGDKARKDNHYYCDKAPGVSLLALAPYWVVYKLKPEGAPTPRFLAAAAYASTVFAVGVPAALSVVALAMTLFTLGVGRRRAVFFAAAYALGTLAWPYATLLYGHQLAASLLVIGASALIVARHGGARPGHLIVAGLALGFSVVVEYPAFLGVCAALVYAAFWLRPARRFVYLFVPLGLCAAVLLGYHWAVFGGPFTLPYEFSTQPHRSQGFFMGLGAPSGEAIFHLTVSPFRGLWFSAPWLALAFAGSVYWWRSGARGEVTLCATICLLFLWLNSSLVDWQGGWTLGARYLVPSIPFWALLAAGVATAVRGLRPWLGVAGLLAVYSAAMMLMGVAVKPEVPGQIARPFSNFLIPQFVRGQLAISRQSIDSRANRSSVPEAWNLGELLGFSGLWELAPLLIAMTVAVVWLVFAIRAEESV